MKRKEYLKLASKAVSGDRDKQYGHPPYSLHRIAEFWSVYIGVELTNHDVALMMAMLKISRAQISPEHEDSYTDIAGYGAIAGELSEQL